jgi:translation elongation factor EF-Tu-like GTPase
MPRRCTFSWTIAAVLCVTGTTGCGKEPDKQDTAARPRPPTSTYDVALLGDKTRSDLLTSIASAYQSTIKRTGNRMLVEVRQGDSAFRLLSIAEDSVVAQAGLAWEADLVLLAVDATQGPLAVHREHILLSRQMAVPNLVIAFTRSRLIDDPELLELEELEMRELLNKYTFPGDNATCVFDDQQARTRLPSRGPTQIVQSLSVLAKKRTPAKPIRERNGFRASVYALVPQEAFARNIAIPVKSGPATAVVGNETIPAEITAAREIAPGQNGTIQITFAKPIPVSKGQRFLLLHREHVAAAGSFLEEDAGSR